MIPAAGELMISFIVPAYNEEAVLGGTLDHIHAAARTLDEPYEIVVADDASTDRTAEIAREHGAQVVSVHNRQIAATRNAGARAAQGEYLIFVDADTPVTPSLVAGSSGSTARWRGLAAVQPIVSMARCHGMVRSSSGPRFRPIGC